MTKMWITIPMYIINYFIYVYRLNAPEYFEYFIRLWAKRWKGHFRQMAIKRKSIVILVKVNFKPKIMEAKKGLYLIGSQLIKKSLQL